MISGLCRTYGIDKSGRRHDPENKLKDTNHRYPNCSPPFSLRLVLDSLARKTLCAGTTAVEQVRQTALRNWTFCVLLQQRLAYFLAVTSGAAQSLVAGMISPTAASFFASWNYDPTVSENALHPLTADVVSPALSTDLFAFLAPAIVLVAKSSLSASSVVPTRRLALFKRRARDKNSWAIRCEKNSTTRKSGARCWWRSSLVHLPQVALKSHLCCSCPGHRVWCWVSSWRRHQRRRLHKRRVRLTARGVFSCRSTPNTNWCERFYWQNHQRLY